MSRDLKLRLQNFRIERDLRISLSNFIIFSRKKMGLSEGQSYKFWQSQSYIKCLNLVVFSQLPPGKPISNIFSFWKYLQKWYLLLYLHSNWGTLVGKNSSRLVSSEDKLLWHKYVLRGSKVSVRFSLASFHHSAFIGLTTSFSSSTENIFFKSVGEYWLLGSSVLGT